MRQGPDTEARGDLEQEGDVSAAIAPGEEWAGAQQCTRPGTEGPGLFGKWKDETSSASGKNKASKDSHLMGLS